MKNNLIRITSFFLLLCLGLQAQQSVSVNPTTKAYASPTAAQLAAGNALFVVTSGSYSNPAWVTALAVSKLSGTGTVAGLTAGHVTTNANLTGPVTSAGNATSVAAQTGNGSVFAMQDSPAFTTPDIGSATATTVNSVRISNGLNQDNLSVAIGSGLLNTTSSEGNTTLGLSAAPALTSGSYNVVVGNFAMNTSTVANGCVAIGYRTLRVTEGFYNIAIGPVALESTTTGEYSVAVGYGALQSNVTGDASIGIGYFAGKYSTAGGEIYLDNQDRTNTAGDKAKAIFFGTMNAIPTNQQATLNVGTLNVQNADGSGSVTLSTTNSTVAMFNGVGTSTATLFQSANSISIGATAGTLTVRNTTTALNAITGTNSLTLGANSGTIGSVKMFGSTSGNVTIRPNAVAGTNIVLTAPATMGTLALTSDIPAAFNPAAPGAIGGTTPAAGTFTTLVAGSATSLLVGTAGSIVGSVGFRNATSGTATLAPPTGALGTYQVTLPNAASALPIFGQQITFTGPTAARSIALPDANWTAARTDAAQSFTGAQTFAGGVIVTDGQTLASSVSAGTKITLDGTNEQIYLYANSSRGFRILPNYPSGTGIGFITINGGFFWNNPTIFYDTVAIDGLTASKPVFTNASKQLVSGSFSVPQLVATGNATAQIAANASVATYTTPNDSTVHSFRVGGYVNITAISAGTLTVQVSFTDETGAAQTLNYFGMGLTSAGLTATGFTGFSASYIRCNPNTAITFKTTFTGVSITYDVGGSVESLY